MTETPFHNTLNNPAGLDLASGSIFNELFDRYQPGLLGLAFRILGNQEDAEDVITETFLKLWQSPNKFENHFAIGGWLRVTARNHCLNILKQQHQQQDRFHEMAAQMKDIDEVWHYEDLQGELLQEVYEAMNALPEKSREVFRLRYVEGMKNEDIAEQLGIRHQSVRNHLTTALKHLRITLLNRPDLVYLLLLLHTARS